MQINTAACCVLYKQVADWVAAPGDGADEGGGSGSGGSSSGSTLLLDVCCGTGTIGLTMAASVTKVVGVDLVESAIVDARHNAQLNGLTNCEYIAGKVGRLLVLPRYLASYHRLHASLPGMVRLLTLCRELSRCTFLTGGLLVAGTIGPLLRCQQLAM